jgi:hypothetical protein
MKPKPLHACLFLIVVSLHATWPGTLFAPNEKVGPRGREGPQGDDHAIPIEDPLGYRIQFENLPSRPSVVRRVEIRDRLDTRLDLSTFRPTSVGVASETVDVSDFQQRARVDDALTRRYRRVVPVGKALVQVDIELDVTTREARWVFTTLDPATILPVAKPQNGFLPPNTSPPCGEGFVAFTIRASDPRDGDPPSPAPTGPEAPPDAAGRPDPSPSPGEPEEEADGAKTEPQIELEGAKTAKRRPSGPVEIPIEDELPGSRTPAEIEIFNSARIVFDDDAPIETNEVKTPVELGPED